jgi:multidrug transporter EmrE-like cation transporter
VTDLAFAAASIRDVTEAAKSLLTILVVVKVLWLSFLFLQFATEREPRHLFQLVLSGSGVVRLALSRVLIRRRALLITSFSCLLLYRLVGIGIIPSEVELGNTRHA